MRIVFASKNPGKIREVKALFAGSTIEIKTSMDYPQLGEIVEDGSSFWENAWKKATLTAARTGEISLADDSGLEVDYLGGAPGVYSSSYAGRGATDEMNIKKLLAEMRGVPNELRRAVFRCVLVLAWPEGRYETFNGSWEGMISESPCGQGGFGYDPVFYLPHLGKTAAELTVEMKNSLSHRAQAFGGLCSWLEKFITSDQLGYGA